MFDRGGLCDDGLFIAISVLIINLLKIDTNTLENSISNNNKHLILIVHNHQ